MLNRTLAPDFKPVETIDFVQAQAQKLDNGIPLYLINVGEQNLLRIELVFQNVNWNAEQALAGLATNGLINAGTKQWSAREIAEKIDYYGAFLQTDYNADCATLSLYTLSKHLPQVLPVLYALLNDSVFPDDELAIYSQNHQQKLQVSLQKNDYLARKTFAHQLFSQSPYGVDTQPDDYKQLDRTQLLAYYQAAYQAKNCTIIVAGKIAKQDTDLINRVFGQNWNNTGQFTHNSFQFTSKSQQSILIDRPDALQSAIRIGKLSINRQHADFAKLQVLNCVLGGYFGSRLMSNIREDKGYTYGIGSAVVSLKQAGYFFIATEVGTEVCEKALVEIEKELDRIKNELIPSEELALVRNYMMGSLLGSLENAFSHADKFKNIHFSGLGYDYYQNYIRTVKEVSAEELLQTAQTYLGTEDLLQVVVGKK